MSGFDSRACRVVECARGLGHTASRVSPARYACSSVPRHAFAPALGLHSTTRSGAALLYRSVWDEVPRGGRSEQSEGAAAPRVVLDSEGLRNCGVDSCAWRRYFRAMIQENPQLPLQIPDGFDALTSSQKLEYLAALWERADVVEDGEDVQEQVVSRVVSARLDELRSQPDLGISSDEVLRRLRARVSGSGA